MIATRKPNSGKQRGYHLLCGTNRLLDGVVGAVLFIMLLLTCYALWNIYQVYAGAAVDAQIEGYKPDGTDNELGFAELRALNSDVVAWLTLDDTHIDYPLLQAEDNSVYLNRDVHGNFAVSGSIFLDYRNQPDFSDFYTIVYGHHMDQGAMFGDITNFLQPDYFAAHQTGTLYLPQRTLGLEVMACVPADAYDRNLYTLNYTDPAAQQKLLAYIQENAAQYREVTLAQGDVLVALSTCSTAAADDRTILIVVAHP